MPLNIDTTKLQPLGHILEPCEVISIPAGATPKAVIVQLPGSDGARVFAHWTGFPALTAGDFVAIQRRNMGALQYVIIGASAGTPALAPTHDLLSATHSDTAAASPVAGDVIIANATPAWSKLAIGTAGFFLKVVSGLPAWAALAASDIASGILALARGGTGANLSATGGAAQYVKQVTAGGVLTVGAQALNDAKVSLLKDGVGVGTVLSSNTAGDLLTLGSNTSLVMASGKTIAVSGGGGISLTDAATDYVTIFSADFQIGISGQKVNEISTDGTLAGNSDTALVVEQAVKTYVDGRAPTNLLYDSLSTIWAWQEGATFNDKADDSYIGLWCCLNNGQTPDVARSAGGSTDPMDYYMTITFDSAASQAGVVQFLKAADTRKYRGQVVSLSFEAWGTAVSEVRAAVLSWGSTADSLISDVVGTWSTDNPTLATNWSYANTPAADIAITSTRTRYTVNNITIPTTANNIAVFIWTSAEEASTDVLNLTRVKLELGPVATPFVPMLDLEEQQRNYQFLYLLGKVTGGRALGGRADGATTGFFGFQIPVEMVKVPSITLNNGSGNVRVNDGLVNVNVTAISTNFSTPATVGVNLTTDTGLTAGRPIFVDFTATDSFLLFDARL